MTTRSTSRSPLRLRDVAFIGLTTLVMGGLATVLALQSDWLAETGIPSVRDAWAAVWPESNEPAQVAQATTAESTGEAQESFVSETPAPRRAPSQFDYVVAEPFNRTIIIVAAILALAVVSPSVFAFCLFCLLRRHGERFGALIQINQAAAAREPQANPAPVHRVISAAPSVSAAEPVKLDPPTRKSAALFDRLFEETMELQTEIDAIGG